jgi:hypothetical protein
VRHVSLFLACLVGVGCTGQPVAGPHRLAPDAVLIFEQRRASSPPSASEPDWEAWQLYESGRFVYARASAEPTKTRVDRTRLRAVHAWLAQHDFELLKSATHGVPPAVPDVSASCQLRLSTGLVLAPFGDPRYYACDELKRLCEPANATAEAP